MKINKIYIFNVERYEDCESFNQPPYNFSYWKLETNWTSSYWEGKKDVYNFDCPVCHLATKYKGEKTLEDIKSSLNKSFLFSRLKSYLVYSYLYSPVRVSSYIYYMALFSIAYRSIGVLILILFLCIGLIFLLKYILQELRKKIGWTLAIWLIYSIFVFIYSILFFFELILF